MMSRQVIRCVPLRLAAAMLALAWVPMLMAQPATQPRPEELTLGVALEAFMSLHDWTRVPAALFHDFHQSWSIRIKDALNDGLLPSEIDALVEQRSGPREGDVLAIESRVGSNPLDVGEGGGIATHDPPRTQIIRRSDREIYAGRANRIVLRHHLGRIIAVIEIMSPGNKHSRAALNDFVDKTIQFMREGIHVLVVDLFPPPPRDPLDIHKVIWDQIEEEPFKFPPGKDRILGSYESGPEHTAYVEPIAVGQPLPDMPLYLATDLHVMVPLESRTRQPGL